MAKAIISELACMPVHIPGQLPSLFGRSLCTEAALSVFLWNKERHKLVKLEKSWILHIVQNRRETIH